MAQSMKDHLKTQNCSNKGQADSRCPPCPYYIPGHHAKHLKRITAAHYTFKYIKYTIALQSPQLPGWYSLPKYWGTIFKHRNSTSELLLFCRFSHKSQFGSPAWASLLPLPHALPSPAHAPHRALPTTWEGEPSAAGGPPHRGRGRARHGHSAHAGSEKPKPWSLGPAAPPRGSVRREGAGEQQPHGGPWGGAAGRDAPSREHQRDCHTVGGDFILETFASLTF